jgi:hypothetical protein
MTLLTTQSLCVVTGCMVGCNDVSVPDVHRFSLDRSKSEPGCALGWLSISGDE